MMDTILNLGLNEEVVEVMAKKIRQPQMGLTPIAALSRCTPTWLWKSAKIF